MPGINKFTHPEKSFHLSRERKATGTKGDRLLRKRFFSRRPEGREQSVSKFDRNYFPNAIQSFPRGFLFDEGPLANGFDLKPEY
ncbi:MAG: hypothetical protein KF802_06640 [Bdellovibrionaceae bacterium]|nr:hypothetical protein [Pseudobdellovibrionaceae bacterium]MBX3034416.1 hypothetical protein [Pseudobdellovibrionaceae bacterium]